MIDIKLVFFLFVFSFLIGCGLGPMVDVIDYSKTQQVDDDDDVDTEPNDTTVENTDITPNSTVDDLGQGVVNADNIIIPPSETIKSPLDFPPQDPNSVNKYQNSLKPLAPSPSISYYHICSKPGVDVRAIAIHQYEYFPPRESGSVLLCDWLENKRMINFATVQKDYCNIKAQERMNLLKQHGYICGLSQ